MKESEWVAAEAVARIVRPVIVNTRTKRVPWVLSENTEIIASGGKWAKFLDLIAKTAGTDDHNALAEAVKDIEDPIDAFTKQILLPAIALATLPNGTKEQFSTMNEFSPPPADEVRRILMSDKALPGILETSRKWHRLRDRIDADIAEISPNLPSSDRWNPGLPNLIIDMIDMVVLVSKNELQDEGRKGINGDGTNGLNHCVGGFSAKCLDGSSRIVSLRQRKGDGFERLSTAEFRLNEREITVTQHRGHGNSVPTEECRRALDTYFHRITEGIEIIEWSELAPIKTTSGIMADAGYDFTEDGAFDRAVNAWSACLPRRLRGAAPSVYLEAVKNGEVQTKEILDESNEIELIRRP
jgi:hypothetical protein